MKLILQKEPVRKKNWAGMVFRRRYSSRLRRRRPYGRRRLYRARRGGYSLKVPGGPGHVFLRGYRRRGVKKYFPRKAKELDWSFTPTDITASGWTTELTGMIEAQWQTSPPPAHGGGTENNVTGIRAYTKSVDLDFVMAGASTSGVTITDPSNQWSNVRVMVVSPKKDPAGTPPFTPYGEPDPMLWKVYYDKRFTLGITHASAVGSEVGYNFVHVPVPALRQLKVRVPIGRMLYKTEHYGSAYNVYGKVYLYLVSDSSASPHPTVRGMCKLWFTDPDTNR